MRPQSDITVTVRNKIIGGPVPLICIPLVAGEQSALVAQAAALQPLNPDLVEWRIDGYDRVDEPAHCLTVLKALRSIIGDIPLIFTCRIEAEGGMRPIDPKRRLDLIQAAVVSGQIDIVDIELSNPPAFVEAVRESTARHGVKLILSYHDFTRTPDEAAITDKLHQAQNRGADIAKVAVMPKDHADVLTLLKATLKARTSVVRIPMITIAMAAEGRLSRLAGGLFGSDITFAIGDAASAPGQVPVDALRQAMTLLY